MLLDTLGDSTTRVVTWATSMEVQLSMVLDFQVVRNVVKNNPAVVDFWTNDGGTTVYAEYVSRNFYIIIGNNYGSPINR